MIIWRGWGVLAFVFFGVGTLIGVGLGSWGLVGGFLAAAVATWFVGQQLNRKGPQKKLADWKVSRRNQLDQLVQAGQFSLGPGQQQPRSVDEARRQSDELLAAEENAHREGSENRHTLFWIPMQYLAPVMLVAALYAGVKAVTGA